MKLYVTLALLLALSSIRSLTAQEKLGEPPVFLTPIANSMEEAVKQQIIQSRTLPKTYETNLFSLNQTIVLRTGLEVQATRTVGRNLTFNPSIDLPEEAIGLLVREACLRVPFSGWRENADLLSDRVSKLWAKFSKSDAENYARLLRTIPTEYYEFNVSMQYDPKNGEPPELTLYNLTNGFQSAYDETLVELKSKLGMFAPSAVDANAPLRDELDLTAWFKAKIANSRNHESIIEKASSRWPLAVHVRLASSSRDWSAIIGERSIQAPDRTALTEATAKLCRQILASNGDPLKADTLIVPTAEIEQPMIQNGVQLLSSRKTLDGMDRIEIRFRLRPASDDAAGK